MYMDASILVVGVLALKVKSEFQLPIRYQKERVTTVITFFLSAYIAKFDLVLSLASKTKWEKQM